MPALKVYRTPIGFHDAYVAAPSQKAALKAWGSDADLFARGVAEVVTDPELTAEPLAHPGEVIRRSRGGLAEQLAALPEDKPAAKSKPPRAKAAKPKPKRDALEAAEQALAEAEQRHRAALDALRAQIAALEKERQRLERDQAKERAALEAKRDEAEAAYQAALERWRSA